MADVLSSSSESGKYCLITLTGINQITLSETIEALNGHDSNVNGSADNSEGVEESLANKLNSPY